MFVDAIERMAVSVEDRSVEAICPAIEPVADMK